MSWDRESEPAEEGKQVLLLLHFADALGVQGVNTTLLPNHSPKLQTPTQGEHHCSSGCEILKPEL